MPYAVTLHVFSGRENPSWVLESDTERDVIERVRSADRLTNRRPSGTLGRLGYRGFSLLDLASESAPERVFVHEGVAERAAAPSVDVGGDLEQRLLESAPPQFKYVVDAVRPALGQPRLPDDAFNERGPRPGCPRTVAKDAPHYKPKKWNIPAVQPYNNCYNYANDQITGTFAQPGRATGLPLTALSCPGTQPSAVSDGLVAVPGFAAPLPVGGGWYVALVIWPGFDYHWYRQDSKGCWSHKPGGTPATDLDNSGAAISDPATCDRGPYTDFCTYMVTNRGVTII